jgi:hypothetical protein
MRRGLVSRIHRKKPKGRPMPERTRLANAQKSKVRSAVEHVFAHQKGMMGLFVERSAWLGRGSRSASRISLTTCAASSGSTIDAFPRKAEAGQNGRCAARRR